MINKNEIILEKWIKYFDFTASWLSYKSIEDKIQNILLTYANTHSEVWYNAKKTSEYYENARNSLRKNLELNDDFYILPCWNWATSAIKKFQEILWIYISPKTKERLNLKIDKKELPLVIIWPFEHHSNELSFREWLCENIRIPLNSDWEIDLLFLEKVLKENKNRELLWSFSVASNVTWIFNPIEKISNLFKKYNWILALDSATSSPYLNVNNDYFDALFLSPHKLLWWPWSCWILIIRKSICENFEKPTFSWWWTVDYVSKTDQKYSNDFETIEDYWTPGILQFIKASLAYELRNNFWLENIKGKEEILKNYFLEKISEIENLELYWSLKTEKLPIFSFNIKWLNPYKISEILSEKFWIQTRAGCSCAWPYWHDLLHLEDWLDLKNNSKPGWIRVWLHFIHEKEDIDFFVESLKEVVDILEF